MVFYLTQYILNIISTWNQYKKYWVTLQCFLKSFSISVSLFLYFIFSHSLCSILFCIGFRCTAQRFGNHILYKVLFPEIFQVPIRHRTYLSPYYCLYPLCCTVHPCEYFVTANSCFLIPSPFARGLQSPHSFIFLYEIFESLCVFHIDGTSQFRGYKISIRNT